MLSRLANYSRVDNIIFTNSTLFELFLYSSDEGEEVPKMLDAYTYGMSIAAIINSS